MSTKIIVSCLLGAFLAAFAGSYFGTNLKSYLCEEWKVVCPKNK
jgi:hypothetical protein